MDDPKPLSRALCDLPAYRLRTDTSPLEKAREDVPVVVEQAITIDVGGLDRYTLLCTPVDLEALAVGFLFTEGVIDGIDAISSVRPCESEPAVLQVRPAESARRGPDGARSLLIASSCGLCGVENLEVKLAALPRVGDRLRVDGRWLRETSSALRDKQTLFRACGGVHAAGLFDGAGHLRAWAEDAGRHNALDKAIGKSLIEGAGAAGCGAVLSGRVSLDMAAKCARAGVELISAISAPTALAVEVARRCDITLCAFVRETRATVFSHPRRLTGMAEDL
ncbi:MAG: formate dehydrogenase accessory sulfurtransferase FdhD [Armatimonadetes bacterium]|nr:formate dehydrogenase accessory sulfurtransferase FdhD [Armatimonadota bacterium]